MAQNGPSLPAPIREDQTGTGGRGRRDDAAHDAGGSRPAGCRRSSCWRTASPGVARLEDRLLAFVTPTFERARAEARAAEARVRRGAGTAAAGFVLGGTGSDSGGSVRVPALQDVSAVAHVRITVEACAVHEADLRARYPLCGARLRSRLTPGSLLSGVDCVQAQRRRRALCAAVGRVMAGVDLLLTTGTPTEAKPRHGDQRRRNLDLPPSTAPFNVTGQPAITVCAGRGEAGLPLWIQLAARPPAEPTRLAVADVCERALGRRDRRPPLVQG